MLQNLTGSASKEKRLVILKPRNISYIKSRLFWLIFRVLFFGGNNHSILQYIFLINVFILEAVGI